MARSKHKKLKAGKNEENELPSPQISVIQKWDLPDELTEISGLSYLDDNHFACVQDELGTIFIYNTSTSSVEKEIQFGAPGDYEGLAIVNETAWVLRADGKLFEVNNITGQTPSVKQFNTSLTTQHDTEGLCYDKQNNRLLIGIKESELHTDDYKGIYSFDLASNRMDEQPAFKIFLRHEVFAAYSSKKKKKAAIMPSGMGIHPTNGDIYITDGRNSRLLITDIAGTIKSLYQLNTVDFLQPEGITFNPAGELFICNEGADHPANILKVRIDEQ